MGYSFRLAARVLLYASSHRKDDTYHGLLLHQSFARYDEGFCNMVNYKLYNLSAISFSGNRYFTKYIPTPLFYSNVLTFTPDLCGISCLATAMCVAQHFIHDHTCSRLVDSGHTSSQYNWGSSGSRFLV